MATSLTVEVDILGDEVQHKIGRPPYLREHDAYYPSCEQSDIEESPDSGESSRRHVVAGSRWNEGD